MYTKFYATVYPSKLSNTEKVTHKTLSISEKTKAGTWESEYWTGKFVGKAKELIDELPDKTRLLVEGNVHNGYNKDKLQYYPYILVTKAEIVKKEEEE